MNKVGYGVDSKGKLRVGVTTIADWQANASSRKCAKCKAVFAPVSAQERNCKACQRKKKMLPSGMAVMEGSAITGLHSGFVPRRAAEDDEDKCAYVDALWAKLTRREQSK